MLRTSRALDCQQAAPSLPLLEQRQHTPEQSTLPAPVHSRRAVRRTNGGRRGGWCAPSSLQSKAAAAGGGCLLCSIGFLTFFPFGKGIFSFLYLKKLKFQKYMAVSKNFKTIPLSPPAWATGPKYKKKLHLDPGTWDALNSKLVKSI